MIRATTKDAYKLFHEGSIAFSQIEATGMRVDVNYLNEAMASTADEISGMESKLKASKIYKQWRKRYRSKTNLGSREQLGEIIFNVMEYPCTDRTKMGKPKTDGNALESVDIPFVKKYLRMEKIKKARGTYLNGILRELKRNGRSDLIHPVFNLHTTLSYRSSSDTPNFQNIPIRDPEISKLIRQAFIPRKHHHIVELDYERIEVHGAAWYCHDPVLIEYLNDDTKDMHRDMAQECYLLPEKEVSKDTRYCGKNKFVFPQFYNDWYINCARNLWNAIHQMDLETTSGIPLKRWLRKKEIRELGSLDPKDRAKKGTFVHHIKTVEHAFWYDKFNVYRKWKDQWWNDYCEIGRFEMLSGFEEIGFLTRNQVCNIAVQGTASHCLLWSLIRIMKLLKKYNMGSFILGPIHDSLVCDVLKRELKDFIDICREVMTDDLMDHWKWITTPMKIEAEVAPLDKSWYEKKEYK